ncbi:MAG: nucleotidyltransferase domain-containing protein [Bacteroidales bacterium]|nr:nucleotidyltransferase domain-containing protein [Bacteroidales bacterium]
MKLIYDNITRLRELCKRYNVHKLYVFGSILTNRFNETSDVDLLVNFNSKIDHNNYADNYFGFFYALKALFNREVDLVDNTSIRNKYFRQEVDETKQLIYG